MTRKITRKTAPIVTSLADIVPASVEKPAVPEGQEDEAPNTDTGAEPVTLQPQEAEALARDLELAGDPAHSPDDEGDEVQPADVVLGETVAILVTGPKKGFRRAGLVFGPTATALYPAAFDAGEANATTEAGRLLAILTEPRLSCVFQLPDGSTHPVSADFIRLLQSVVAVAAEPNEAVASLAAALAAPQPEQAAPMPEAMADPIADPIADIVNVND